MQARKPSHPVNLQARCDAPLPLYANWMIHFFNLVGTVHNEIQLKPLSNTYPSIQIKACIMRQTSHAKSQQPWSVGFVEPGNSISTTEQVDVSLNKIKKRLF